MKPSRFFRAAKRANAGEDILASQWMVARWIETSARDHGVTFEEAQRRIQMQVRPPNPDAIRAVIAQLRQLDPARLP